MSLPELPDAPAARPAAGASSCSGAPPGRLLYDWAYIRPLVVYDSHIPTTREDTPITTTDTATFTDSDLFAAIKVTDYVNRSTDTALADLVRHAAMMGVTYLRRGTPETSFTGKHNDELYGKAIAFAQAAQIATSGAITDAEIIAAARVEAAS